ncbi:MAG: UDP-N-acetylmuramoyl-L-alanyl-D-glutamate--2,6-diaminopimelate ligase [Patescibacteria group bacterium]
MNIRKIVKLFIPSKLFGKVEPYGHLAEAFIFNLINGFPARGMKIIGVTGTNGKTTTSYMIHKMLHESGYKTGLMTTVAWGVGDDIQSQIHHYTNVPLPEMMQRLKKLRAAKIDWLVLETTSQALAQNRVWGIPYSVAVMTNVTHEHLDYHKTFERYRDAKRKLFKLTNSNKRGLRTGVINADDPSAELFAQDVKKAITYGVGDGEICATDIQSSPTGSQYTVKTKDAELHIKTNLPGSFNVYNSLAVVGVGLALDLKPEQIEKGIAALDGVSGRMTNIEAGQDFDVIVDFAHTPDSFELLFKDLKPVAEGKLIVMFGSAGRRDEAKRAVQGELAGKYCDEVILTEEDDRDIDGNEILNQIAEGAEKAGKTRDKDLFLILDRTEAINFTLKRAGKGDTVLLLGKGHEKTIERDGREDPWDEVATVRTALR